ncbi:MAG: hypothetical protein ABIH26_08845 [Candidatus Eisenbacteria bacterium]
MAFFLLIMLSAATALCPSAARADGRFLQSEFLPIGARYLGMGGGHAALPDGASSAYYNPALLPWSDRLEFAIEGSFVHGPEFETEGGRNRLTFHDRGNFSMVGLRLPDAGGFSFAILELTVYDHDIRGHLFGTPPEDAEKPVETGKGGAGPAAFGESEQLIRSYHDRVSVNSFGLATGYKTSENTSFGLAFWADRKKVFKSVDYLTACTDISDDQIGRGWFDAEATTNDVSLHFTAGLYHRFSDKADGGLSISTGMDLTSVHQIDEWKTCTPAERRPIVDDMTPFVAQVGAAYYFSRTLRFAGDIAYQNWGNIETYRSTAQLSLGAEWEQSERVIFRGGFFTLFDPSDLPDDAHAEALRDIERSGNILGADEFFFTAGAGYWLTPYLLVEGALADSELLSPEAGRTSVLFAFRFLTTPAREENR